MITGVGAGLVLGLARAAGFRPGVPAGTVVAAVLALVAANGPMAALGVSDPRTWSASDWTADVVPHLAYGLVTAAVAVALDTDD